MVCARAVTEITIDQIIFPTEESDSAEIARDHALDVAQTYDATLHVLNVADTTGHSPTRVGQGP